MPVYVRVPILMGIFFALILSQNAGTAKLRSATLNLNYVSETLVPGNTANLQGGGFTAATAVELQAISSTGQLVGAPINPTIVSNSANLIQFQIPSTFPQGMWAVWLVDASGNVSVTAYINQARGVRFGYDSVAPGGTVEVWGRNLGGYSGASTSLVFVDPNQNQFPASVTYADANHIVATAPTKLTPGTSYQVYINNGLAGLLGQTLIPAPLTIRAAGPDPLGLGVPWGADFTFLSTNWKTAANTYNVKTDSRLSLHAVGDGVTDDARAIQKAVNTAAKNKSGGGIVYLPTSTYLLGSVPTAGQYLAMAPNVVIMGDGPGLTTMEAGITNSANAALVSFYRATLSGISSLTFINLNLGGTENETITCSAAGNSNRLFLQNVDFQLNNGLPIYFFGVTNLLISNSSFETTNAYATELTPNNNPYLTVVNNTFNYLVGRMTIHACDYALIRNNSFIRNGLYSAPGTTESGAIDASLVAAPVIADNQFVVTTGALGGNNDGETIFTQDAGASTFFGVAGTITAAKSLYVRDSTQHWSVTSIPANEIIAITSGVGLGQWRYVTAMTSNTVEIDHPWDFMPPVGSSYTLTGWSADRVYVLNNTFTNSIKAVVELYGGSWDSTISGNMITTTQTANVTVDDGGILLHAIDDTNASAMESVQHDPTWQTQVFGNTSVNKTAKHVGITVVLAQENGGLHANGMLNNEVRNNLLDSLYADKKSGFAVYTQLYNTTEDQAVSNAILGTIFEGNQAIGLPDPYQLGVGQVQTVAD